VLSVVGCLLIFIFPGKLVGADAKLEEYTPSEPHCLLQPTSLVRSKSGATSISSVSEGIDSAPTDDNASSGHKDLIPGIHSIQVDSVPMQWGLRMMLVLFVLAPVAFCTHLLRNLNMVSEIEEDPSTHHSSEKRIPSKIHFSQTPSTAVITSPGSSPGEPTAVRHYASFISERTEPKSFLQLTGYTLSILFIVAPTVTLTVLLTSDITTYGRQFYSFIMACHHASASTAGLCFALVGYFVDAHTWQSVWRIGTFLWILGTCTSFLVGMMCMTSVAPSIPIIVGLALTMSSCGCLRNLVFHHNRISTRDFSHCCGTAFLICSVVVLILWLLWVLEPGFGGVNAWDEEMKADFAPRGKRALTGFLLWSSPLIISIMLVFCSILAFLRSHFHTDLSTGDVYVGGELKWVILLMFLCTFGIWIASSMTAMGMGLPQTVIRLSCSMFVGIVIYVSFSVGLSSFEAAAEHSNTVAILLTLATSDWVKGFFMLILGPMLPAYFGLEVIHESIRRLLQYENAEAPGNAHSWLTVQSNQIWIHMRDCWNWTSVLKKSVYCALFYFSIQVGFNQGVTIFLSWLNNVLHHTELPLWAVLIILFVVGQILFLLPPIPGVPIYLVAGLVITERCQYDGTGVGWGVVVACIFSYCVKMVAIILQQKMIGQHFADNVGIRKLVGVQTVGIRAVELILEKKGLHTDKVAVLVGGPDWPTSVLTGILRLRLAETLLGSTPCFLLIVPVVLAAFCMSKATVDVERQDQWMCLAHAMLMMSALTQAGAMIVAGFYLHRVANEHFSELSQLRNEDKEVLEAVKADQAWMLEYHKRAGWSQTPTYMRIILILGAVCMTIATYLMVMPSWMRNGLGPMFEGPPFRHFTLSDKISDLPGGSLASLVNGTGWIIIWLIVMSTCCLIVHYLWAHWRMRGVLAEVAHEPEMEPELSSREPELASLDPANSS